VKNWFQAVAFKFNLYRYAVANAKEITRHEAKRKARALDDFAYLIKSARREVRAGSTWEAAEAELGSEAAWRRCVAGKDGCAKEARVVFDEWVGQYIKLESSCPGLYKLNAVAP
jgi:hypothetical protein